MRDELLSIGEMARLKNVTVKALRYYERIGVLDPAYVDPDTGYRYYRLSQSMDVDVITTCAELGAPLKELKHFRREDGAYELEALLEHGQRIAQENLRRARRLAVQATNYREGVSIEPKMLPGMLPGREFLLLPWASGTFDAKSYVRISSRIYDIAERRGYISLFLMGMVRLPSDGSWNVCVEVERIDDGEDGEADDALLSENASNDARLYRVPKTRFSSRRIEGASYAECFGTAFEIPSDSGPLFAFETWERECDPGHVIVDVVVGDMLATVHQ